MLLLCTLGMRGQSLVLPLSPIGEAGCVVTLDSIHTHRHVGDSIGIDLLFRMRGAAPARGRIVTLTPRLVGATDSIEFPSVHFYSRWAYYHEVRSPQRHDSPDEHYRADDVRDYRRYVHLVPQQPWMADARLKFVLNEHNDCGNLFASTESQPTYAFPGLVQRRQQLAAAAAVVQQATVVVPAERPADTIHVVSEGDIRFHEGTAYINFPVNSTEIFPDYHDNASRLEEIRATIDSVLHQDRSRLQHITLKGYASPEGSYAHNENLARGRVHSLRRYLIDHFDIPAILVTATYEPEDWEGLRRHVIEHALPHWKQMVEIIDSDRHPDDKLARIRYLFPYTYGHLVNEVFPYLRHTDYRIDYLQQEPSRTTSVVVSRGNQSAAQPADVPARPVGTTDTPPAAALATAPSLSDLPAEPLPETTSHRFRTYRALFAVKSNLLFDAALAPNIEVEIPFGRSRWSLMLEDWFPWFRTSHNSLGDVNPYYRSDQRPTRHSYEIWTLGAEVRYWFSPRCNATRPALCGTFVGLYAAGGKYDVEWKSKGDQGEFTSIGLTVGRSWPIARHWNLELSGSIGYVGGPQRHYEAEFDDARLIFRNYSSLHYFGPTKLKLSLSWLIGRPNRKGGAK